MSQVRLFLTALSSSCRLELKHEHRSSNFARCSLSNNNGDRGHFPPIECLDQIVVHNAFSVEAPIRRHITPVRVTYRFTYNFDDSHKPAYTLRRRPPCALVYYIHAVYTRVYGVKDGQTNGRPADAAAAADSVVTQASSTASR